MTKRVTVEEMLRILDCWRNHSDFPEVFDAICATLKELAALEQENDKLRQHLDIDTKAYLSLIDQFCALEKENAELKAWKVGVVERTIRALMPKKIDPDEAEHIIRDIAAEGEKK